MIYLLFSIPGKRYALPAQHVTEVVPDILSANDSLMSDANDPVITASIPHYFAGFILYRERQLPVIDLCQLIRSIPCRRKLSTRIVLVDFHLADGSTKALGIRAEKITQTINLDPKDSSLLQTEEDTSFLVLNRNNPHQRIEIFDAQSIVPRGFDIFEGW